jgi:hypothetical protein
MSYPQQGYQAPAAPVDRDVHGILIGVEARNAGWMRFLIQEQGRQYPYKADTKKPEVIQAGMSLMQQPVSANVREQNSAEINPHTGQPYLNRYLNAIAPQGYAPGVQPSPQHMAQNQPPGPAYSQPAQQPQQAAPPTQMLNAPQPGISGYERDVNIMRQCASKCATMMLSALPEEQRNPQGLIAAAETWMAYYVYGPLRFGVQPFSSSEGQPRVPNLRPRDDAPVQTAPGTQPDEARTWDGITPCPDCGFSGQHAIGCPRGDYA